MFVNLTRFPIEIVYPDGTQATILPSGKVAETFFEPGKLLPEHEWPCGVPTYTEDNIGLSVYGIPPKAEGVYYIVSKEVATAIRKKRLVKWGREREDQDDYLYTPAVELHFGPIVKDNYIVAVTSLIKV